jgi:hypothetical protein
VAEPREENQGESGSLLKKNPKQHSVPKRRDVNTQTQDGTPAPDSEKSGPRRIQDRLTVTIEGIQHTLLALTQGFKMLVSAKRQAQNAHARRDKRQVPKTGRPGSPWTPLWGYSKTIVLWILG